MSSHTFRAPTVNVSNNPVLTLDNRSEGYALFQQKTIANWTFCSSAFVEISCLSVIFFRKSNYYILTSEDASVYVHAQVHKCIRAHAHRLPGTSEKLRYFCITPQAAVLVYI